MIHLTLSPGVAYDLLAEAVANATFGPTDETKGALMLLDDQIQRQVGAMHHEHVCASEEYRALIHYHSLHEEVACGDAVSLRVALEQRWFSASNRL